MATLYKHGEIGQIERVAYKLAYCEDGKILRNDGDGWKQWRKLKPGLDPKAIFEERKAKYAQKLADNPAFAAWRSLFHSLVSFKHRNIVLSTISMMPGDPDGCWSTFDDYSFYGVELSLDEWVQLCRAYEAAQAEARSKAPATPQAEPSIA